VVKFLSESLPIVDPVSIMYLSHFNFSWWYIALCVSVDKLTAFLCLKAVVHWICGRGLTRQRDGSFKEKTSIITCRREPIKVKHVFPFCDAVLDLLAHYVVEFLSESLPACDDDSISASNTSD
jgi:hypothetical protein